MTDYKAKYDYAEIVRELRQDASTSRDLYLADAIEQLSHHANDWEEIADCWRKRYEEAVRHGRWTRIDYEPLGHDYICSECGRKNDRASQYCPDCGTKMEANNG